MFCLERGNALSEAGSASLTMEHPRSCYEEVKKMVIGSRDNGSAWIVRSDRNV